MARLTRKSIMVVRPSQLRAGAPVTPTYGAKWNLPRPQERVPRIIKAGPLRIDPGVIPGLFTSAQRRAQLPMPTRFFPRVYYPPASALVFSPGRPRAQRALPLEWKRRYNPMHQLRVAIPHKVAFCVRRKIRRAVLHAMGYTGKGSGPRRNQKVNRTGDSQYACSR